MSLYENWISKAYDKNGQSLKKVWDSYMPLEQKIYENMLANKQTHILGTVSELAGRYGMMPEFICGFLDGIKEALTDDNAVDIENIEETTFIDATVDFLKLYKKMVEYKADHLYNLDEWDNIFTPEQRKIFYLEQKKSTTIMRDKEKIGRNDPCPCGSGKKYKKCCALNQAND